MLSFFRRVSKSKIGTWIMAAVLIAILGGFALADLQNFGTGSFSWFGGNSGALVKVGDREITEREVSDAMQRRLAAVREQNPTADYAAIAKDFEPLLDELIQQQALLAFAEKYRFTLSKRLIDAQIADIPGVRGLNGQPNAAAYQAFLAQQRLTDKQVRDLIASQLLARYLAIPVATEARVPVGLAAPFASMLLEAREGGAAVIPFTFFTRGLAPGDADLQRFYAANRARYMVPEQRIVRIATIGPDQVSGISATPQEIAAYYNANQATYGSKETRTLSQAVVPDQASANGIAARAKAGATIAQAAAPAGANAAVTTQADQTRQAYSSVAGDKVAAAVFAAKAGTVVGPFQSDFGWVVVKVEGVKGQPARSLDQVRGEIATKILADKRKGAIEDIVDRVQNALDEGQNFAEAVALAKLPVTTTPLITATGTSRTNASYRLPQPLAPALKVGFDIGAGDTPEVVTLGNDQYAIVAPAQVVPAAPAPLASIRDRVKNDWILQQAMAKAKAAADSIAAKASAGQSLADAVKQSGVPAPVQPLASRRIQIAQAQKQVPPPIRMLFTLSAGKSKAVPDEQGRGYYVVKVDKIVPGSALLQPALIGQMRSALQQSAGDEYAQEFMRAVQADLKVRRNESAIEAVKKRLATSGG
jgi:peptidyl-prolyl cis-trans isomerase D